MKIKMILGLAIVFIITTISIFGTSTVMSWVKDMYNQVSIKYGEPGSMLAYPLDSVTTTGLEITTDGFVHPEASKPDWIMTRNNPDLAPANPITSNASSLKEGKYLYDTYCTVCHGKDGMGGTPVGKLRGAAPISILLQSDPSITEGYLYYKITYGGMNQYGMPPLGYATSETERWHIVNYLKYRFKTP